MISDKQVEAAAEAMWREETAPIKAADNARKLELWTEQQDEYKAKWRRFARAALTAAEAVVKVKPLEWRDAPEGVYMSKTILADSITGQYSVTVDTGVAYFDRELCGLDGRECCQRIHNATILSALEIPNG